MWEEQGNYGRKMDANHSACFGPRNRPPKTMKPMEPMKPIGAMLRSISRWFSTLYILSPHFHTKDLRMTQVDQTLEIV